MIREQLMKNHFMEMPQQIPIVIFIIFIIVIYHISKGGERAFFKMYIRSWVTNCSLARLARNMSFPFLINSHSFEMNPCQ